MRGRGVLCLAGCYDWRLLRTLLKHDGKMLAVGAGRSSKALLSVPARAMQPSTLDESYLPTMGSWVKPY